MEGIGNKIKSIRELKNYTQEFVAEKLGITQAGYSKIECGETDIPYSKLEEIATVLGVKPEDLVAFDQQRFFNSFNNVKGNNNGGIIVNELSEDIKKLYDDKIILLEKLYKVQESELHRYKDKFGDI